MQNLIFQGDCIDVIKELIKQDVQVDSIVTDPPYELGFMNKDWDKSGIAYNKELWELCLKILRPGGHLLAFGGSRTYHRMACAIEDAGFEIRDQIMWIYGSGFPKSLDISKAIDKAAGIERQFIPRTRIDGKATGHACTGFISGAVDAAKKRDDNALTNDAKQWQGWGTALKPAHEPIVLARKPLDEKTIAANVLKFGTGAINIDGCRVSGDMPTTFPKSRTPNETHIYQAGFHSNETETAIASPLGRFPANLIHDGSDGVESEFAEQSKRMGMHKAGSCSSREFKGWKSTGELNKRQIPNDDGTASRFFYCAKASKKERNGSKHPTVKPIALMRYLCRLITPPGGTILDPFAGSGTTGQAANEEGFNVILIEKNEEYINDINKRLSQETQLELNDFAA
jgi:DNA modification methylase